MIRSGSPAYLVVSAGFVLSAVLSGSVGCAMVHDGNTEDASAGNGGSSGAGGVTGAGGSTSAGSGGFASGAGGFRLDAGSDAPSMDAASDSSLGCRVNIVPVAPPTYENVEAGMGAHMRVQAVASGTVTQPVSWHWTVNFGGETIMTTAIDPSGDPTGATVEFPIENAGAYTVNAQLVKQPTCNKSQGISTIAPGPMAYVLRATAAGFPVQDLPFALAATDPQSPVQLPLAAGVTANLSAERADLNGGSLASYVRITDPVSSLSIDGDSTKGPVTAPLVPRVYDVLVVPFEPYAPNLIQGTPPWSQPLQLDQGVKITATTLDAGGSAVVGARLVLRRGTLPSTVGVSDQSGAATLWGRAGTLAAYIEPPIDSGLPSAAVGAGSDSTTDPGIVLDSGVGSLTLSMTWDPVTSASLSIHVLDPGGAATGAGARVRATSQAAPGPVGTLIAQPAGGPAVTLRATGSTDVEVATDATGTAVFSALPVGAYDVTVVPASTSGAPSASTRAITTSAVTLAPGGLTRDLTLATKATLSGMLLPISDSPGTQVTAIDRSATAAGTVVSAIVAADGTFKLFVDPGRGYELLAQPPAGAQHGRAILASSVSSATPTIAAATLPIVHPTPGTVTAAKGGGAIGGVLVQAFCPSTSSRCLDATFPLAEAITRADGTFTLLLPDPPGN